MDAFEAIATIQTLYEMTDKTAEEKPLTPEEFLENVAEVLSRVE